MVFKDRKEAGEKLVYLLKKDPEIKKNLKNTVVVSLLRGGIIVGDIIAKSLKIPNLALVITKIPASYNSEFAIGGLCFDVTYLEKRIIESSGMDKQTISQQIESAHIKQLSYLKRFELKKNKFDQKIKDKNVIIVDDGIATGSTVKAALLYLKEQKVKSTILAVPVAPFDFDTSGFDKVFALHQDPNFTSVSHYYQNFPQVGDEEVKELIKREQHLVYD